MEKGEFCWRFRWPRTRPVCRWPDRSTGARPVQCGRPACRARCRQAVGPRSVELAHADIAAHHVERQLGLEALADEDAQGAVALARVGGRDREAPPQELERGFALLVGCT